MAEKMGSFIGTIIGVIVFIIAYHYLLESGIERFAAISLAIISVLVFVVLSSFVIRLIFKRK